MELEQAEIINLAVNIFQNVGIKRYIGDIEALKHEEIYFQIYKIIFPDSMINIFKISQSQLTTGEKIQKIIEQISSQIKLDLYHISGKQIALGNLNHIVNWLQLLQALSNNFIGQNYQGAGGSAPDRDQYIQGSFQDDGYHTVIGMGGEFEGHGYEDEPPETTSQGSDLQDLNNQDHFGQIAVNYDSQDHTPQSLTPNPSITDQANASQDSRILKPVRENQKKNILRGVPQKKPFLGKKKVTFNLEKNGGIGNQSKGGYDRKNNNKFKNSEVISRAAGKSSNLNNFKRTPEKVKRYQVYGKSNDSVNKHSRTSAKKQSKYITKMFSVIEQLEKKHVCDAKVNLQNWVNAKLAYSDYEHIKVEAEDDERKKFINQKIMERDQMMETLLGEQGAVKQMRKLFKDQKYAQKKMKDRLQTQNLRGVSELLETNFAAEFQNRVLMAFGE